MKTGSKLLALMLGLCLLAPPAALACSKSPISDEAFEELLRDGYARDRQGDYRGAVEVFQRAIALRPTNRKVRYLIANTFWRDNQWARARFAWETVLRMGADDRIGKEAAQWLKENDREGWAPAVRTLVGSRPGFADGLGRAARFDRPQGMAVSPDGQLYITDTGNHRIRRVSPDGKVVTVAGAGVPGWLDGPALRARMYAPTGGTLDPVGNYFFADGARIRFLSPGGQVGTLAGDGVPGFTDGGIGVGRFARPIALAADWRGFVFVADNGTAIRGISPEGEVRTVAGSLDPGWADGSGSSARFRYVTSMQMLDKETLLILDTGNNRLRELHIPTGMVKTHPGCQNAGFIDGPLEVAHWRELSGFAVDEYGNLLMADSGNRAIRRITIGQEVQTLSGGWAGGEPADGNGIWARFADPSDLALYGKTLYILDRRQGAVRTMNLDGLYH
ncbi:MAG: tetratricopeptide repeat protein [Candidatus Sericytochromatia bacterium]|nr:tetratricopeptide repeat protein [Candidatus Sericytochromatia bacterium]